MFCAQASLANHSASQDTNWVSVRLVERSSSISKLSCEPKNPSSWSLKMCEIWLGHGTAIRGKLLSTPCATSAIGFRASLRYFRHIGCLRGMEEPLKYAKESLFSEPLWVQNGRCKTGSWVLQRREVRFLTGTQTIGTSTNTSRLICHRLT